MIADIAIAHPSQPKNLHPFDRRAPNQRHGKPTLVLSIYEEEEEEESDQEEEEDGGAVQRNRQAPPSRPHPQVQEPRAPARETRLRESEPREDAQDIPTHEGDGVQEVQLSPEIEPASGTDMLDDDDDLFGPDPDDTPARPSDTQRTLVATPAPPQVKSSKPAPRRMAARRRRPTPTQDTSSRNSPIRLPSPGPSTSSPPPFIQRQPSMPRSSSRQPPASPSQEVEELEIDSDSPDEWDEDIEAPRISSNQSIGEPEDMEEEMEEDFDDPEEEDQVAGELMESASAGSGTAARPSRNSPSVESVASSEASSSRKRKNGSEGSLSEDDEQTEQALAGGRPRKAPRSSWNPSTFEKRLSQTFAAVTPVRRPRHTIAGARHSGGAWSTSSVDAFPVSGSKAREMKEAQKKAQYSPPANTRASQYRKSGNWNDE